MGQINLNKKVYVKNQYEKVIDTKFSQLATSIPNDIQQLPVTNSIVEINTFFEDYSRLFYQIPKTGSTNSHEYLVKTSNEYIGSSIFNEDIQALIDEINILQQQNLELNQQIVNLAITGSKV
jgi:hypothetical protein